MRILIDRRGDPLAVFDHVGLARLERDIDRILADDGRERAGRGTDQIADGEIGDADAAVDRRADLGIAEIDLGLFEQGLRFQNIGLGGLLGGLVLIDRRLRDVLVFHQFLGALQLQVGVHLRRLGPGEIGLLLIHGGLVSIRLDAKQQIAGLDHLAFGEIALPDKAGHTRDDIDLVDGNDAADEIAGFRHLAIGHSNDRNRGRGICALGQRRAATGERNHRDHQRTEPCSHAHPRIGCSTRSVQICTNFRGLSPGRRACAPRTNRFAAVVFHNIFVLPTNEARRDSCGEADRRSRVSSPAFPSAPRPERPLHPPSPPLCRCHSCRRGRSRRDGRNGRRENR